MDCIVGHVSIPAQLSKNEDEDKKPIYKVLAALVVFEVLDKSGNQISISSLKVEANIMDDH